MNRNAEAAGVTVEDVAGETTETLTLEPEVDAEVEAEVAEVEAVVEAVVKVEELEARCPIGCTSAVVAELAPSWLVPTDDANVVEVIVAEFMVMPDGLVV